MFATVSSVGVRPALRAARVVLPAGLLVLAGLTLVLGGCSRQSGDTVLATVGDRDVTVSYYEERLGKLEVNELPRDQDGVPVDTGTLEGKKAFLDVIINKELMAAKAVQLGYDKEEQITGAAQAMLEFQASQLLHKDLIEAPANFVSEEQVAEYYSHLSEVLVCSFIICNFEEDALKARQAVIDGGLWEDVAAEYHDGQMSPQGNYQVKITWGRWEDTFEQAVFALKEGEVSRPVETVYGYWVVRLEAFEEERVPPLDSIKEKVLNSIRMQQINLSRVEFLKGSRERHEFEMSEDGLWTIFQGLPEGEVMLDPETNKPIDRSQLKPLDIPMEDMDQFFYQVRLEDELTVVTVGDYKVQFDQMNTFQRPKKSELLGGVRQKILETIDRKLILAEAREQGYFEDPRARSQVAGRTEEMMVSKLHTDLVQFESYVGPQDLDAFWAEHQHEYLVPEGRDGFIVFCENAETAGQAYEAAQAGADWAEILNRFETIDANKEREGQQEMIYAYHAGPIKDALFALAEPGQVSEPFEVEGTWTVVRLGKIQAPYQQELAEVRDELGQRIKLRRQDEALRELLTEWAGEFGVVVYEDRLAPLRSWEEIKATEADL